jgi:ATP-dependent Clp protease ATP-binding subunit ClpC
MNLYYLSNQAIPVLATAREEAARLHHEYVGGEHLLLGLLKYDAEPVDALLSVNRQSLIKGIENVIKQGNAASTGLASLPYTSRAKHALDLAGQTASELKDQHVGPEHLLIGLLKDKKGIAAQVLMEAGLTVDGLLTELKVFRDTHKGG